jgi:predicted secreted hydrolase
LCVLVGCGAHDAPSERAPASGGRLEVRTVLGGAGDDHGFSRADAARAFEFPADHGPHRDFRSEWWYVTVALHAADGERFGVQFTVFRQALSPAAGDGRWRTGQVYMAHAAITNVARQRHEEWQRIARDRPALGGAMAAPFAVWLEDWRLASTGQEFLPLELDLEAEGCTVALTLEADKPLVLQGDEGLSRKGEGQASYYYSFPRLKAAGTLRVDGSEVPVHGTAWVDREWSTSVLSSAHSGWDWFALHLEDGSDLMAFQLRRVDGERDPFDAATWIDANGRAETLGAARFALSPTRYWTDERGVRWPVAWRLEGDRWREPWLIEAAIDDQRMDTAVEYWEGLVTVKETGGREIGEGYMELTGYALQ